MSAARLAAICALLSAACALANLLLMALAVDFDLARLRDFTALHDVDARGATLLVASMVVDVAFYVLLVPCALLLPSALHPPLQEVERATLATQLARIAGVTYATLGACGALALALAWPRLIEQHDVEGFTSLTRYVYVVVWNRACAFVGAAWWLAVAWHARSEGDREAGVRARALFMVSTALGIVSVLEGALQVMHHPLALRVLDVELALLPVFAIVASIALANTSVSARTALRA